ncbi:MAG: hypothetical protein JXQ29_02075 [Planctomycetes bacterium]|nr:hypothetical protein [Planctomycetota bacterium]
MCRRILLPAVLLSLLALTLAAQPHTAGWSFTGSASATSPTPVALGLVDSTGKLSTILTVSQLPANVYAAGGTIDYDDRIYVMALLSKVINGSVIQVDQKGSIVQTIQVESTNPGMGGGMTYDVILDQNGDYIVVVGFGGGTPFPGLRKVDRANKVTTIYQGAPLRDPYAVTVDINSGDFVVVDTSTHGVYRIAPDGSAITSVGIFPSNLSIRNQICQDPRTGDYFVGSFQSNGAVLMRMDQLGQMTTFLASGLIAGYGVYPDRASAAAPRLAVGSTSTTSGIFFVDLATKAITTLINTASSSLTYLQVFPARELATYLRSPGCWEIYLHFAGEAGNAYAVGLSLSDVRPGVPLPDGRRILLNVDDLTALSLSGRLGPLFAGNVGKLTPSARAMAVLDVSSLPVLKGLPIWLLAATLNPQAPLGIQTISDPLRITL